MPAQSRLQERVAGYLRYHFKCKDPDRTAKTLCELAAAAGFNPMTQLASAKSWLDERNLWTKRRNHSRFLGNWFRNEAKKYGAPQSERDFQRMREDFRRDK